MKRLLYTLLVAMFCMSIASAQFNPDDPTEPGNKYKLSLTCNPEKGGRVYGDGKYIKGEQVHLTAFANDGFEFSCWKNGNEVVSSTSSFDYIMPAKSLTLTAFFTKKGESSGSFNPTDPSEPNSPNTSNNNDSTYHTLTIIKEPIKGGRINKEGDIKLNEGETIYLYATPSNGYEVNGWYQGNKLLSIQSSYSYTMGTQDDTLTLKFDYQPNEPSEPGSSENKEYILITSQAELEEYANIEEFPRSVRIVGTDITSLQSLSRMRSVKGDLRIENTSLTSLEGLDNLTTITGKLMILQNRLLTTLDGVYSWKDIYYVLIEGNPHLYNFCAMTEYALKGEGAYGAIRENGYNPTFQDIADGNCSKMEDVFKVTSAIVIRQANQLHFIVSFSNEPNNYNNISSLVDCSSNSEKLTIKKATKNNYTYHIYTSLPSKSEEYTLLISNQFEDTYGKKLNQNENHLTDEDEDNFRQSFAFNQDELYVISQAPVEGHFDNEGYTEIAFNTAQEFSFPKDNVSLTAADGSEIAIESIEYIDSVIPERYHINYDKLDKDGDYTFAISANNIVSNDRKRMLYDYEAIIELPSTDLSPTNITISDTNWETGETKTITYTVANNGAKSAVGNVTDVIYLSTSDSWNSEAVELFRGSVAINVSAGSTYTNTVEVNVPMCVDGQYYLILKSNVSQTLKELKYTDNVLASSALTLNVTELSEGNRTFTLQRGESKLFKLPTMSETNVEVIDNVGLADMFIGYYTYPDKNVGAKHGSITLLGSDASMTYYLLMANNAKSTTKVQECELFLRTFELDITNIGRTEIVKTGTAWVPLEITGCATMPVVSLMNASGEKFACQDIVAKSETSFYAQFDVSELPVGSYGLYVDCNGVTGVKANAINIVDGQPTYSMVSKLVLPETSRIGSTITAFIDYHNAGNVDAPVPLFILTGQEGSSYTLPDGITYEDEVHIIGLNQNGVINNLMPGESNRISVNINMPTVQVSPYKYKLKTIALGCDGMDEPFYLQWLDIDPDDVPSCYTAQEWSEYCNIVRKKVGNDWNGFIKCISTQIKKFFSNENLGYDASTLYSMIKTDDNESVVKRELIATHASPSETLRDVVPGTLFLWQNGSWVQLTEPKKDENDFIIYGKWNKLKALDSSAQTYIISHGWRDDREGDTKSLAVALSQAKPSSNIIAIDWSQAAWTNSEGFLALNANGPAVLIPMVADWVVEGLCEVYGASIKSLRIGNLHLIGHSHGAHICGMIAHKLNFKPKRLTALDASTTMSHLFSSNYLGAGWNRDDVEFLEYYKSSIMAGTNLFKGHNNFILIENNDGFEFSAFSNDSAETARHGYSIKWYASTITNPWTHLGFQMSSKNLAERWNRKFNHDQYHGVINASSGKIENFDIRDEYGILPERWNYTYPWYYNSTYQFLFNDWIFRNALASTVEYNPKDILYPDDKDFVQSGTLEFMHAEIENNTDNFSIPFEVRRSNCMLNAGNILLVGKKGCKPSLKTNGDGTSTISFNEEMLCLYNSGQYVDSKMEDKTIGFFVNITPDDWKRLGGNDELDFLDCDFCVVSSVPNKQSMLKLNEYTYSIDLWKGELYPENNFFVKTLRVKNPNMACDAGNDQTIILLKGEVSKDVYLNGKVIRDNGLNISHSWYRNESQFSNVQSTHISLPVGTHHLKYQINGTPKDRSRETSTSNEAEDEVIITIKPYTPGDNDDEGTNTASSWDPNEKVGTAGVGSESYIRSDQIMDYTIYFENDAEKATMAAQKVTVTDVLDETFDLSTFEFTGVEVANTIVDIPAGLTEYSTLTDLRPTNNLLLKTDLKLDIDTRVITAEFSSIDPETGEFTQDVWAGFLPPNNENHDGEGHFSYRVKLKDEIADGYKVKNLAEIYFDYNDCIETNETLHTIDTSAPTSFVSLPYTETRNESVEVQWNGEDKAGIKFYDIYVSKDGGQYELWQNHTIEHSALFEGERNHRYSFYSIATDSLGWTEAVKTAPDAQILFANERSQSLVLNEGWNWISLNLQPANGTDISTVLGNEWTNGDYIKSNSEIKFNEFSTSRGWKNTGDAALMTIDNKYMYHVKVANNKTIVVDGIPVNEATTPITLHNGWNWISYLPQSAMELNAALADYPAIEGDVIKSISAYSTFTSGAWTGSLTELQSGHGYMLYSHNAQPVLFYYGTAQRNSATRATAHKQNAVSTSNNRYANNMTVVAKVVNVENLANTRLVASVSGETRGAVSSLQHPATGDNLYMLTVSGDSDANVDLTLYGSDGEIGTATRAFAYKNDVQLGTVDNPLLIELQMNQSRVYPSPFTDVLYVQYVPKDANADVTVMFTNFGGQIIDNISHCNKNGYVEFSWSKAAFVPKGIYMVSISENGNLCKTYKIIKK